MKIISMPNDESSPYGVLCQKPKLIDILREDGNLFPINRMEINENVRANLRAFEIFFSFLSFIVVDLAFSQRRVSNYLFLY
jgi:hypothetical protein